MNNSKIHNNDKRIEAISPAVVHPTYQQFADMLDEWLCSIKGKGKLSSDQADDFLKVLPEIRIIADFLEYEQELRFPAQLEEVVERLEKASSKVFAKTRTRHDYKPTSKELHKIYQILCGLDQISGYSDETGLSRIRINSATLDQIRKTTINEPVTTLSAFDFKPHDMPPEQRHRFVRFINSAAHSYLKFEKIEPLFVRRGAPSNVIRGLLLEALLQAYERATGRTARRNDTVLQRLIPDALQQLYDAVNQSPVRFHYSNHVDNLEPRARANELLHSVRYIAKIEHAAEWEMSRNDIVLILSLVLKRLNQQHNIAHNRYEYPQLFTPSEFEDCNWHIMQVSQKLPSSDAELLNEN